MYYRFDIAMINEFGGMFACKFDTSILNSKEATLKSDTSAQYMAVVIFLTELLCKWHVHHVSEIAHAFYDPTKISTTVLFPH